MGVELQHLFLEVVYFKTLGVLSPETQIVVFWGFQLCSEPDSNNTCLRAKYHFETQKSPVETCFEEQHLKNLKNNTCFETHSFHVRAVCVTLNSSPYCDSLKQRL